MRELQHFVELCLLWLARAVALQTLRLRSETVTVGRQRLLLSGGIWLGAGRWGSPTWGLNTSGMLRGLGSLLSGIFSSLFFYVPWWKLPPSFPYYLFSPFSFSGVFHLSFFSFFFPLPTRLLYLLSSFLYTCFCILSFLFRFFLFLRLLWHLP